MIGLDAEGSSLQGKLGGATRLQKFLYLLETEEEVQALDDGFKFEPYKAGPFSSKIYDSLEFLENLGYIKSEVVGESTSFESVEIKFEDLIGKEDDSSYSDSYVEKRFKLTEKGRSKIQSMLNSEEHQPTLNKIRKIKSNFSKYSLRDLLYYVYKKYPGMTTESEVKKQVLKRGF